MLPQENSIVQSAMAIVGCMKDQNSEIPLEAGKFFQNSRKLPEYTYEFLPAEEDGKNLFSNTEPDIGTPNTMPSGRRYSKQQQTDGSLVWCVTKALSGQPIATVTIRPVIDMRLSELPGVFDPNTLGEWSLIPESYRTYWAFDRAYCELDGASDEHVASRELYERIESYLADGNVPCDVRWAMDRLAIKMALRTDDLDRVRQSVRQAAEGLCTDPSLSRHRCLLELARISGLIQKQYPEEPQEWLRPFVSQVVACTEREGIRDYLERLMPTIEANRWFTYGNLLLEEIHRQGIMDEHALWNAVACVEGIRLAQEKQQWDNSESLPSVRDYLAQLDGLPPKGVITMDGVRHILKQGFAKCYSDDVSQVKLNLVEDVIRSLRQIVGEGPFRGDANELAQSMQRFSECYSVVNGGVESIGTVLATFMALSFCDLSTPEDHEALFSQFRGCSTNLQSQVNTMLKERELDSLISSADVEDVFEKYEWKFRRYIDDPLWPPFKFPWTANEEARLFNTLVVRLMRLEPILDEIALKVKYAGGDVKFKKRLLYDISRVAEQLLVEAAFLRTPLYPGVSCYYRGKYALTAAIEGPLYRESDRPREKFKAMKYFHLGHRLEDIVERERELARISETQEPSQ